MVSLPHGQIEFAESADLRGVQSFYAEVGYGAGTHPGDRLIVAREDQSIVAAVRLCAERGTLVLRGMFVAENRRGQGIGSRLLESVSATIGSQDCWCIPYTHLIGFYSQIGFCQCKGKAVPLFLAERRERYVADGRKVAVMRRSTR